MSVEVRVPSLGESVSEASVGAWYKSMGDLVETDELICELETDKVNLEISSPAKGQLSEILFPEGSTVLEGALLATISTGAAADAGAKPRAAGAPSSAKSAAKNEAAAESKEPAAAAEPSPEAPAKDVEHAPSARKLMAEHQIDPGTIQGTGRSQRIMKEDVQRAIEASMAVVPADAQGSTAEAEIEPAEIERVRMSRLRRTIATRLKEAQNTAAMLTTYNEVDMTNVMKMRADYKEVFEKKHGARLGFMFVLRESLLHRAHGSSRRECGNRRDGNRLQTVRAYGHCGGYAQRAGSPGGSQCGSNDVRPSGKTHRRTWQNGSRRQACIVRHARRNIFDIERRRLRLPDVVSHTQSAAIGDSWNAQDPGTPGRRGRQDRNPSDDVFGLVVRSPHRGRKGCGDFSGQGQGSHRRSTPIAYGNLIPSIDDCDGIGTETERKTLSEPAFFQCRHAGKRDPRISESPTLFAANYVEG